jgi:hypothetical protein
MGSNPVIEVLLSQFEQYVPKKKEEPSTLVNDNVQKEESLYKEATILKEKKYLVLVLNSDLTKSRSRTLKKKFSEVFSRRIVHKSNQIRISCSEVHFEKTSLDVRSLLDNYESCFKCKEKEIYYQKGLLICKACGEIISENLRLKKIKK